MGVKPGKGAGHLGGTAEGHPTWPLADWDQLPCGDDTEPASQAEEELGEGWWWRGHFGGGGGMCACTEARPRIGPSQDCKSLGRAGPQFSYHCLPLTTPSKDVWPLPLSLPYPPVAFSLWHFSQSETLLLLSFSRRHLCPARM